MPRMSSGRHGEQLAAEYLQRAGLRILDRNWRCAEGEIDIVAADRRVLVVVRGEDPLQHRGTALRWRPSTRQKRTPAAAAGRAAGWSPTGSCSTRCAIDVVDGAAGPSRAASRSSTSRGVG